MKLSRLAFLAAVFGACPAAASPPGDIAGTWECRLPGIEYRNKPPILYVADTGGDPPQVTIEVDGFAREIYGRSEIAADQGGWWKVKPAQGQEFMIRPMAARSSARRQWACVSRIRKATIAACAFRPRAFRAPWYRCCSKAFRRPASQMLYRPASQGFSRPTCRM